MATVIVTDANILINLCRIGKLPLLGALEAYDFRVPIQVVQEITEPAQREAVQAALTAGHLTQTAVESLEALELYGSLREIMGAGEAACLALAATAGLHVASDEKKRFRRRAHELLGEARVLRTEFLLLAAIRAGQLSVADADECKRRLESMRYVMPFGSFSQLATQEPAPSEEKAGGSGYPVAGCPGTAK